MKEKQFIVTDKIKLDSPMYTVISGATFSESHLREWANDRWGAPKDVALEVVAKDIKHGGWMLFELIDPADFK